MNFDQILEKAVDAVGEEKVEEILEKVDKIMEDLKDENGNVEINDWETAKKILGPFFHLADAFMQEGGNDVIAEGLAKVYGLVEDMDDDAFAAAAIVPLLFDKSQAKEFFAQIQSKVTLGQEIDGRQKNQALVDYLGNLPEDRYRKFTETTEALLPDAFVTFLLQLAGTSELSFDERLEKSRKNMNVPAEESARKSFSRIQNLPADIILDAMEEIAGKINPDSVKALRDEFTKRVRVTDFVQLGHSGAAVALGFMEAAANDAEATSAVSKTRLQLFGAQLAHILQSLEDAIIKSGIINDEPDLGKRIREAMLANQLEVIDQEPEAQQLPGPDA